MKFILQHDLATLDPHFSPITGPATKGGVRNTCLFNKYDAIVDVGNLFSELSEVFDALPQIEIPAGYEDIRHQAVGGFASTDENSAIQERIDALMKDISIPTRNKLFKAYERDFTLFGYKWNTETNEIF